MNLQTNTFTFILAFRYLRGRMLRTVLTTLAIVFGVLVIFGVNILLPTMFQSFQANILAAAGQVDATITLKTSDAFDARVAEQVAAIEGIRVISGHLNRTVNVPADYFDGNPEKPDLVSAVSLVGINPDQAQTIHAYHIKEGRFLETGDTAVAVISESLVEALRVGLGDNFVLPTARGETELTVIGILPARAMPGNEEVLVTLPQAQSMLAMPGKINTLEANFETVDDTRRTEIENDILAALGETYQIGSLTSNSELLTNIKLGQNVFNLLGVLALLMGGFIIFNTFRTIVVERRRDIGMLRALGASRGIILGMFIHEGLIQGLVGTALGLALGYLLGAGMTKIMSPLLHQFLNMQIGSPVIPPGLVAVSVTLGIGVTLLAGLLPAIVASQVTPLEALRPSVSAFSLKRMAGIGFWSGVTMIALATGALITRNVSLVSLGGVLFMVGLILVAPALVNPIANLFSALIARVFARNGTAQLAEGNLSRQPTRAAITASTTLIALAILIMAATIISSIKIGFEQVLRKSLGSEYILIPPSIAVWGTNVGAGSELAEELRLIDGVSVVSTLRFSPTKINDVAVSVLGIDPLTYPHVSGLTFSAGAETTAYSDLEAGRNIILNPVLATSSGADVGDEVELITPTGPKMYRIVAVAGDYLNAKIATAYISQGNIGADFNRDEDVLIQLNLSPQANRQSVEGELKATLEAFPQFRLINGQEYIEESLTIFNASFMGLVVLVIFLAVPSLIAMINTLAIGVIERTREIGMLRAVGATRKQVRTIILAEAIILAAIGTAFGILAGLYLGYMAVEAIRSAGFPMVYVFPASGTLLGIATGLGFGVLAAIIPARQAARLEIVQALRYE
jgi:putative ABC transport system permease protein